MSSRVLIFRQSCIIPADDQANDGERARVKDGGDAERELEEIRRLRAEGA
jgi:hypothetical protein